MHGLGAVEVLAPQNRGGGVVEANVGEHLRVAGVTLPAMLLESWLRPHHRLHGELEQAMRAQPHWVDLQLTVSKLQRVAEPVKGQQHVLDDVPVMVVVPDGFALGDLEQGDLWRHEPAEQEPEPELVAERDDQLPFPRDLVWRW